MERVICDCYEKKQKRIFGKDPETSFNKRIVAVNNMYGWLYNEGILKKVSFEFKDYSDATYFAVDVEELKPYREAMENSGIVDAALAVNNIFDAECTPCLYSGAIELGWTMLTYRDTCGCVSRSWECELVRDMQTYAAIDIRQVKEEKGVKEAVKLAFELSCFDPSDL